MSVDSATSDPIWTAVYDAGVPASIVTEHGSLLSAFRTNLARSPDATIVRYVDRPLSAREVDRWSEAFAHALLTAGFEAGDRVVICLQNVPYFPIAVLGTWKAGGVIVPVNPAYRERELEHILHDSGATVVVCGEEHVASALAPVIERRGSTLLLTASGRDFLADSPVPKHLAAAEIPTELPGQSLDQFCADHFDLPVEEFSPSAADPAMLAYTSGTTGPPKGAVNSHGNMSFASQVYRDFLGLQPSDPVLAMAPLSHVTGVIGHFGIALSAWAPLVLLYRFEPGLALDLIERHRCNFAVGPITAFISMMDRDDIQERDLSSLERAYSGGAPVPASLVERFERLTDCYIHNCFGMTETTAPAILTPVGARAPIDPRSGALSIGVPVPDTDVVIRGDDGVRLRAGEIGEICIAGPQVIDRYWDDPAATEQAFEDGYLLTGDIGFVDEAGWVYIVDRKKDQINVSGYKVWPRDVEDVLYEHDAVVEAAVVGISDPYRGETVQAFVRKRPGRVVDVSELQQFCRERLAAYKCPSRIEFVESLPRTPTGKISRQAVRAGAATTVGERGTERD